MRRGPPILPSLVCGRLNYPCFQQEIRDLVPNLPAPCSWFDRRIHPASSSDSGLPASTSSQIPVSSTCFPLASASLYCSSWGAAMALAVCLPLPLSQHRAKAVLSHSPRTIPAPCHSPIHPPTHQIDLATSPTTGPAKAAVSPLPQAESGGPGSLLFPPLVHGTDISCCMLFFFCIPSARFLI